MCVRSMDRAKDLRRSRARTRQAYDDYSSSSYKLIFSVVTLRRNGGRSRFLSELKMLDMQCHHDGTSLRPYDEV